MMGSLLKCTFLCQTHNFFLRASFCMKKFSRGLINLNPRMSSKICLIIPKTTCLKMAICDWQYNKQYPSLITINLAFFSTQSLSIHSVLSSRPLLMMANKELLWNLLKKKSITLFLSTMKTNGNTNECRPNTTSQTVSRLSFCEGRTRALASGGTWSFSHSQFRVSSVEFNERRKKRDSSQCTKKWAKFASPR